MQVGRLLAENEVTRLERPDLVESAVAVEFSSRMQTVWQVRVLAGDAGSAATCGTPDASVPGRAARTASCTGEPSIGTFDVGPPPAVLRPAGRQAAEARRPHSGSSGRLQRQRTNLCSCRVRRDICIVHARAGSDEFPQTLRQIGGRGTIVTALVRDFAQDPSAGVVARASLSGALRSPVRDCS